MAELTDKLKELMASQGLKFGSQLQKERERGEIQPRVITQRGFETQRAETQRDVEADGEPGEFEVDKCVPGEVVAGEDGAFYLVRTDYPLDEVHGGVPLGSIFEAAGEHIALVACDEELAEFDPGKAVFVDIETTGLAGGAGTTAFLVGAGYFAEGVFRLDQCFMRDFDDEEPMLNYLQEIFKKAETVVTFNGKTFDVPLLRSRFISNRLPFRLDAALHYDLIHAVRRIFKLRLKDCSLSNVEREVLSIRRHGDIPGSEIPQVWFDYLRTRDARVLPRVFYHHRMDVVSLVALTALMADRVSVPCGDGFGHAEDRLSLARLHFRQKRFEQAAQHAERLLECETESRLRQECLSLLGLSYKRLQYWAQMEDIFSLMAREFPRDLLPRLELAKHHEHHSRNLVEALRSCNEALELLQGEISAGFGALTPRGELERRKARLEKKMAKRRPDFEE